MFSLLVKLFIKNKDDVNSPKVRAEYATVSGILGICFNLLLFALKFIIGTLSGYVSIVADAFNNFTDAGSSLITMIGFRVAKTDADKDHPYGHGRSEYISGLVVAMIILLVGYELIKNSVIKIINPSDSTFSKELVIILILSMAIKFYMYLYNKSVAKKLDAPAIFAVAKDSINDVIITGVVLLSAVAEMLFGYKIDGFCGVLVGLFILKGGYDIFKETSGLILGHSIDEELKDKINELVISFDKRVLGMHDLMVHDYGPGRRVISLHAEVSSKEDIIELHDMIDNLERALSEALEAQVVIHMDPIVTDDEEVNYHIKLVNKLVKNFDESITIHDFRMVKGPTHTNLIFDIVLPFDNEMTPKEATERISKAIYDEDNNHFAVITVDRPI